MEGIKGLTSYLVRRYGTVLLEAVDRGLDGPVPERPEPAPRPDDAVAARYEALRNWRKRGAARRGVDTDVILSNAVLWELAELTPATQAYLETVSGLGPWKRAHYGPEILQVLSKNAS